MISISKIRSLNVDKNNVYDFLEKYARSKCQITSIQDLLNYYKVNKNSKHLRKYMVFDDVRYGRIAMSKQLLDFCIECIDNLSHQYPYKK